MVDPKDPKLQEFVDYLNQYYDERQIFDEHRRLEAIRLLTEEYESGKPITLRGLGKETKDIAKSLVDKVLDKDLRPNAPTIKLPETDEENDRKFWKIIKWTIIIIILAFTFMFYAYAL